MSAVTPTTYNSTADEIKAALQFGLTLASLYPGAGEVVALLAKVGPAAIGLFTSAASMLTQGRGPTTEEVAAIEARTADNLATSHSAAERARAALS